MHVTGIQGLSSSSPELTRKIKAQISLDNFGVTVTLKIWSSSRRGKEYWRKTIIQSLKDVAFTVAEKTQMLRLLPHSLKEIYMIV